MSVEQWTERALLDRLCAKHSKVGGNGPEWAYMEHVRDGAGHYAGTTIDALALHLWPSRNNEVHAFEVKVSRADFRRELEHECTKSASWRAWVQFFWIVAPSDVVPPTELPDGWGLLVPHAHGLRAKVGARRLTPAPTYNTPDAPIPRPLVAAMLRAQVRNASKRDGFWTRVSDDAAGGAA